MLKSKLTSLEVAELCASLSDSIDDNKHILEKLVREATNTSRQDFEHDYEMVRTILKQTPVRLKGMLDQRKPKGEILILLSYNEPLILSVEPVLAALIAGNDVYVRAGSRSTKIMNRIWEPVLATLEWQRDRLHLLDKSHQEILRIIPSVNAVYFFGSQNAASAVGAVCAENLVEFWPETEGADFAIYTDSSPISPRDFAAFIGKEAFVQSGQVCQRIHGVFVHAEKYESVASEIIKMQTEYSLTASANDLQLGLRHSYEELVANDSSAQYYPGAVANTPSIITNISPESPLCQKAFFLPTLWLAQYKSKEELLDTVAARPVQFGCNVWSLDSSFVNDVSARTRLTRITVNTSHVSIREGEGWGGSQPTSFGGNMQWLDKFSNPYAVITG